MPVEERSLTSGALLEETKSLEIGVSLSTPFKWLSGLGQNFTCQRRLRCFRSHDRSKTERRVLAGEASRRAGCGKSARPVRWAGVWKRSMAGILRHRQPKGSATD